VIALRGTEGILEWLHDAAFLLVKCPFLPGAGSTEDGFTAIYGSLATGVAAGSPTVAQALTGLPWKTPVSALTICGHSLGRAQPRRAPAHATGPRGRRQYALPASGRLHVRQSPHRGSLVREHV